MDKFINQIINDDCLNVLPEIPDKSIDMILCDLPYGSNINCKWDTPIDLNELWKQYKRIIKNKKPIVLTASQPFTSNLVMSNPKWFKCEWIWEKNRGSNFGCVKFQPMKEHENILVFGNGRITYNPIKQPRKGTGNDRIKYKITARTDTKCYADSLHNETELKTTELRYPSSIQKFNTETGYHPTQKPVTLFEYLIKTYSNEEDLILDNAIGSGTTAIACINTNRNYIGIEKDEKYCEIARKRIEEHINN